ncbi:Dyp-type peroxidase [Actinokineospora sp. PR83]|uniref:Dyp-type peroxidase n=1 Tax=Actinokineospora sp. PR83 TaxID=2884908 RepID=UPI001F3EDF4B|nr:Dyp-type peroxidase domain-containing protein [Actinokineospora sp. PR83]MCG8919727.1 Dyp-type peroxidase [Actinokineospora sp. PR83]
MSPLTRRELLGRTAGLAALACLAACADPGSPPDRAGLHPALRTPRPAGAIAFLGAAPAAREALLAARAADVTVGLGATLAPEAGRMPDFPGEVLLPERTHPDAFVQVEGDDQAECSRRLDAVLATLPGLAVRWRTPVRRDVIDAVGDKPLQRNPFGFVEGQTNTADAILLPSGASLVAVRVIRMAHQLWDADPPETQRRILGRHPDGTWLDGTPPLGTPDFTADPDGATTPLDSHVRTMNPRTPGTPAPRMLRRSWIYEGTPAGALRDDGVVFMAFQNDFSTGFALAQQRLTADALHPYLLTVGGGYFVVPA